MNGGPPEVVVTFDQAQITASGSAGTPAIMLPGTWTAPSSMDSSVFGVRRANVLFKILTAFGFFWNNRRRGQ